MKATRCHAGRLVAAAGQPVDDAGGGLTRTFPSPTALAEIDPGRLELPQPRRRTLCALVTRLVDGSVILDPGSDWHRARQQLQAMPGIGPWTTEVIAMRGLGDPDAFPATDLGVQNAANRLGLPTKPPALTATSHRWRPWRSYATQHLWSALAHPVNTWPPKEFA